MIQGVSLRRKRNSSKARHHDTFLILRGNEWARMLDCNCTLRHPTSSTWIFLRERIIGWCARESWRIRSSYRDPTILTHRAGNLGGNRRLSSTIILQLRRRLEGSHVLRRNLECKRELGIITAEIVTLSVEWSCRTTEHGEAHCCCSWTKFWVHMVIKDNCLRNVNRIRVASGTPCGQLRSACAKFWMWRIRDGGNGSAEAEPRQNKESPSIRPECFSLIDLISPLVTNPRALH